ncbi:MAG: hypothetical protein AB7O63_02085 [Reyranellaceae bacterium]
MPTSVRETIAAAIAARLATTPGGPAVRRNPDTMATDANAIDFYEGDQTPISWDAAATQYAWTIELELFHAPGANINELYAQTLKHLLDQSWLTTLPGFHDMREEGLGAAQIDREAGHDSLNGYLLTLTLEYWTKDGDPYAAGP